MTSIEKELRPDNTVVRKQLIKILKKKNDYSLLTHFSIWMNIILRKAGIRIDNRIIERSISVVSTLTLLLLYLFFFYKI